MFNIVNWSEKFETADTRKRQRLGWFLAPSGNDSKGYRKLMRQGKDGVMAYGVFMALCQYMATLSKESRGSFVNSDGTEMDFDDLSEVTRIEVADIRHATGTLVACGWITPIGTTICQSSASHLPPICQSSASFVKEEGEEQGQGQGEEKEPKQENKTETQKRVGALVKRRESTKWSDKEKAALRKLNPSEEDIAFLESQNYADHTYRRKDLMTMLNHWNGELDRMNSKQQHSTPQHQVTEFIGNE